MDTDMGIIKNKIDYLPETKSYIVEQDISCNLHSYKKMGPQS